MWGKNLSTFPFTLVVSIVEGLIVFFFLPAPRCLLVVILYRAWSTILWNAVSFIATSNILFIYMYVYLNYWNLPELKTTGWFPRFLLFMRTFLFRQFKHCSPPTNVKLSSGVAICRASNYSLVSLCWKNRSSVGGYLVRASYFKNSYQDPISY